MWGIFAPKRGLCAARGLSLVYCNASSRLKVCRYNFKVTEMP